MKLTFRKLFLAGIVVLCMIPSLLNAQSKDQKNANNFEIELGSTFSSNGDLPFWLHSNRWGIIDQNSTNGYLLLVSENKLGSLGTVSFRLGAELIGRLSNDDAIFFNEGYIQADWQFLRVVIGRKKQRIGITDSSLTSGSMIQSGNASAIPKIRISIPEFTSIPGTNDWVSVKGYIAHGWMEDGRFIEDALLHQKYLYLKVLPDEYPLDLYGGIVQSTMWAGTHPVYGNLPDDLDDFWNVLLAQSSHADDAEPSAIGEAVGSSIGIYDFGIGYDFKGFKGLIHRQFYLETGAGAKFRNAWDGLWGASVKWDKEFQLINEISWSYLYTKRQSSQEFRGDPPFGADSYYNNSTYRSGWTYHGQTIGNPLMFSNGYPLGVINNAIVAQQISFGGKINLLSYFLTGTYSRNYGARGKDSWYPQRKDQYSFLLSTSTEIKNQWVLGVDLAYDTGELYTDRIGMFTSLTYRF